MSVIDPVKKAWQPVRQKLKDNCMDAQFVLYESGNINAAIVGAGGYGDFFEDINSAFTNENLSALEQTTTLITQYPDASSAIGIGGVVVLAPLAKKALNTIHESASDAVDVAAVAASGLILGNSIANDASLITTSACSFVAASAVLKYAPSNPFYLKPGGLGLSIGGAFLAAFGIEQGMDLYSHSDQILQMGQTTLDHIKAMSEAALPALTTLTGIYVAKAGLLTYEGGHWECKGVQDARQNESATSQEHKRSLSNKLFDPVDGHISKLFGDKADKFVMGLNSWFKKYTMPWVTDEAKNSEPFETSYQLRGPFRVTTGLTALAAGQPGFAASNLAWFGGDYTFHLLQEQINESAQDQEDEEADMILDLGPDDMEDDPSQKISLE